MSQAQLAEACGWKSQSRVGNYEAGSREPTLADIAVMAKAIGVDQSEILLTAGTSYASPAMAYAAAAAAATSGSAELVREMLAQAGKRLPAHIQAKILAATEESAEPANNVVAADFSRPGLVGDEVWIAHYDVRAAMGGGQSAHDFPEMLKDIRVSPSHLRELGVEFEEHYHLKMVTGWGQSMEPTIKHRDPLIVNVHIREFTGDGIYLFYWDDHIYIKRLQVADEEHFEMISDNTRHKDRLIRRDMTYIQARVLLVWNAHLV